ncbi:MAG: HAMP domain-containing protein [Caldilineaceae bacterium]
MVILILAGAVVWFVAHGLARPIERLHCDLAKAVASGISMSRWITQRRDEVGQLVDEFQQMIAYQQQMADAAGQLAQGDLDLSVTARSEQDVLGNAFQQMVSYQRQMAGAAAQLAQGDLNVQVSPQSDKDILGNAFYNMVSYQQEIADAVGEVARGNLTIDVTPISPQDALGNAMQRMIAHLRATVGSVKTNAQRLLSSSRQLSQVSVQAGDATRQITQTIDVMTGTTSRWRRPSARLPSKRQQAQVMERTRFVVDDQER